LLLLLLQSVLLKLVYLLKQLLLLLLKLVLLPLKLVQLPLAAAANLGAAPAEATVAALVFPSVTKTR